jgi:RNA polymerase sigma-70 factor, ECF subfamily
MSIIRYRALCARRDQTRRLTDEIEAAIVDTADDPEVVLQAKNLGELLRQALIRLSPKHREIIDPVLSRVSIVECAEIIGIPVATVKTRMFCARRKLAELVKDV